MTLVVLLGGARSGKSALAVDLARRSGAAVTVIATAEALDAEMAERIAAHRDERPAEWRTVEEPLELRAAIERVPPADTLVIDCLSLWVANVLERDRVEREACAAAAAAAGRSGLTVAVTNEVGLGVVPATPLGRAYRDLLGRVNAAWVAVSDDAALVVAGRALRLERSLL
ncbi:MAG TPA: bifunctional adenosylcobinamide kinase/adenosylcobinamide-phosphate guanylyltransferase [Gaiellaceae bacterium]